jgi:enoyl-CoA hydratase
MTYTTIEFERLGAVALVRLNRPDALNALNSMVLAELTQAFASFEADPGHRCAVLTGAGEKAFAAGADIKEMADKSLAGFYGENFFAGWTEDFTRRIRKPWIAAVNGFALGGGCELAMMADFIIASDKARFGQPEIKLGVLPGMGGSQRLTRAVGKAKAMDLCLTGRMMDAAEAERAGLVSRVVAHEQLLEEALAANKEAVDAAFEMTLDAGIRFERRLFNMICGTEDKAEGMAAFVEKRPAVWTGR